MDYYGLKEIADSLRIFAEAQTRIAAALERMATVAESEEEP